jgi:hypothetical protein
LTLNLSQTSFICILLENKEIQHITCIHIALHVFMFPHHHSYDVYLINRVCLIPVHSWNKLLWSQHITNSKCRQHISQRYNTTCIYSETSQNRSALGPKIMAGLEGWPVLWDFLSKEMFSRDLKNRLIFREGWFYEGPV